MARKDILRIYDSALFNYVKYYVENSVPGHVVPCHMATPDRPFGFEIPTDPKTGDVDTDRVTSMLITPQVTLTRQGITYDMQRNNTNKIRSIRYWDEEKNFFVQSEFPRPWSLSYVVDVYARLRNDAQAVLQHFLYYTQPLRLITVDFYYPWSRRPIYMGWGQIIDNSDVESGEKLRYYRYSIPINVEGYMFECFDYPSDIPHNKTELEHFTSRVRTVKSVSFELKEQGSGESVGSITAAPINRITPDGTVVSDVTYSITAATEAAKAAKEEAVAAKNAAIAAAESAVTASQSAFSIFAGSTQFQVTAGSTIYIGIFEDIQIDKIEVPLPAGVIKELIVESDLAPGVGQSFTYTIYKNSSSTGAFVNVTGSNTSATLNTSLTFNKQDRFALELITSGNSAEAKHKFTIKYVATGL